MTGILPQTLTVGGRALPIRADFRNVLRIFEAAADEHLTDDEKAFICLKRLYAVPVPLIHGEEALRQAYRFCDGGDMPKSKPLPVRVLDWKHDEQILLPAVSRAAGVPDIRALPFLHWWTFLGLFGEIGEGLFSTVMHIRQKRARGKKLEKWEQEFLAQNKELVILRTAQEQAEIDETEAFLRELTGG